MKTFILIMTILGANSSSGGGKAIQTQEFTSESLCEVAGTKWSKQVRDLQENFRVNTTHPLYICVEK